MPASSTFWNAMASKAKSSVLLVADPILYVLRVTVVYLIFVALDALIIKVVSWSFADAISHFTLAETFLEYIQLFSALGIAVIYVLHLAYILFYQARHIILEDKPKAGSHNTEEMSDAGNTST